MWHIAIFVRWERVQGHDGHQNTYIESGPFPLPEANLTAPNRWSSLLWLIPVLSIGDLLWAVGAKMGWMVTFGLGLYRWELLHIIFQLALIVVMSIYYVRASSEEKPMEVEAEPVEAAEEDNSA